MIEEHSKKSYTKIGEDEKKEEKMNNKTNDVLKKVNYKLIALDLDGTLTNDEKEIPEYTTRVLMRAQEQGVRIALVSARPSSGLHYERDVLKLQKYGGLLLSYNGERIVEAENGNVLYETTLQPGLQQPVSFTAYLRTGGEYECIVDVGGEEYRRTTAKFTLR